ncbi:MAG: LysR substrate-binding domain-containing protein [Rubrivivax sp.]|jgi:DNA-binding transcriptional LysR family regulator
MWLHNLDELQMLLAVVEAGSFTEAGRRLNVSTSAVSAGVRRLESELGVNLLSRTTRSLRPTAEGEVLLEHGRRAMDILEAGRDRTRKMSGALLGTLSVTSSTVLGTYFLADWLAGFAGRHPDLQLRFSVGDSRVDLVSAGMDVALRDGPLEDSELSARQLVEVPWVACASPAYLSRCGAPEDPSQLARHSCITHFVRKRLFNRWAFRPTDGGEPFEVVVGGSFTTDNAAVSVQWALDGQGILFQSSLALRRLLNSGALVPILEGFQGRTVPLCAVMPRRVRVPWRVRTMLSELSESIESFV